MTAEVIGAFRAGFDVVRHPHIGHHQARSEPTIVERQEQAMDNYLRTTLKQPYLMDGSSLPDSMVRITEGEKVLASSNDWAPYPNPAQETGRVE